MSLKPYRIYVSYILVVKFVRKEMVFKICSHLFVHISSLFVNTWFLYVVLWIHIIIYVMLLQYYR